MTIIPTSFLFRYTLPVLRVDEIPRASEPLLKLPATCATPWPSELNAEDPSHIEKRPNFVSLLTAWNSDGIAFSFQIAPPSSSGKESLSESVIGIFLDTRDTQNQHRGSRFCHHFQLKISSKKSGADISIRQLPVARAREDAPDADPDSFLTEVHSANTGIVASLWIPKDALNGFSPIGGGRLGFMTYVVDQVQGEQALNVGTDFPIDADPSLWVSLELIDS